MFHSIEQLKRGVLHNGESSCRLNNLTCYLACLDWTPGVSARSRGNLNAGAIVVAVFEPPRLDSRCLTSTIIRVQHTSIAIASQNKISLPMQLQVTSGT